LARRVDEGKVKGTADARGRLNLFSFPEDACE